MPPEDPMRVVLKPGLLVVIPEEEAERAEIASYLDRQAGDAFRLTEDPGHLRLVTLGPEEAVRRKPINITSRAPAPLALIGNFAATPFELDGSAYASVEAFWQGLKLADAAERARIAALSGGAAKRATAGIEPPDSFLYQGARIRTGTWDHWQLMRRACNAKFAQHEAARAALLSTGDRPLEHRVKRDSHTIPGVIMADIWMRVRKRLRQPG